MLKREMIIRGHCSDCLFENMFYLEIISNLMENAKKHMHIPHPDSPIVNILPHVLYYFLFVYTHTRNYSLNHLRKSYTHYGFLSSTTYLPSARTLSY